VRNTITIEPNGINRGCSGITLIDHSTIPVFKMLTLEEQVAALRKEIDELRQELTVIKSLLPAPIYGYSVTNASE
jgi:hypothetical protein